MGFIGSFVKWLFSSEQETSPEERELVEEQAQENITRQIISEEKVELSIVDDIIRKAERLMNALRPDAGTQDTYFFVLSEHFPEDLIEDLTLLKNPNKSIKERDAAMQSAQSIWKDCTEPIGTKFKYIQKLIQDAQDKTESRARAGIALSLIEQLDSDIGALKAQFDAEKQKRATRATLRQQEAA